MAEEIINIATFQFDIDKLNSNVDKLSDSLVKLKQDQKGYTDQIKATQKEIDTELKVKKVLIDANQTEGEQYELNEKKLKELTEAQKQSQIAQNNTSNQIKRVGIELGETNKQLQSYMNSEAKQQSLSDNANVALSKNIQNINQARASNTELLRIRNQLKPSIESEAKLITELNAKLDANNAFIKENASAYELQKIGIGDYTSGVKAGIEQSGLLGGKLQQVTQVFNSFAPVFNTLNQDIKQTINQLNIFGTSSDAAGKSANQTAEGTTALSTSQKLLAGGFQVATGAARVFTLALAATGIGLIIGAVVLLIGYFKTFDPVVDAIEQGMAGLGAAVRVVQQAFAGLFSGDFSGFDGLIGKMSEAASAAANLKEAQQDLADAQAVQSINNKRQEGEINRLLLQAKDRSKSEQERIDLLNKAEKTNKDNFESNKKLSEEQSRQAIEASRIAGELTDKEVANLQRGGLAYAKKLLNLGKITDDEVKLIEDAENAKLDIYNRSTQEQEKIINRRNIQIEKQEEAAKKAAEDEKKRQEKAIEDAKKASEARIKAMQVELDFYLESQGELKKDMAEQLAIDKETMRQSLAITKAEYDAKKITKREYELANLEITNEFAAKQVEATLANADIEFELFKLNNQRKLDENKFFSEELYQQELQRLNKVAEAEAAQQTLLFQNGKINAQEYGLAIAQIDANQQEANDAANAEREQAKKEKQAADISLQDELNAERFEYDLALQLERYDRQYTLEKEAAEKAGADMVLFEKAQAERKKQIEQAVQQNKLDLASQTLSNLANIAGKESAAGKAFAIAQATIDTYSSAVAAYRSLVGIPVVGPALATIAAGSAVVSGFKTIKQIASVKEPSKPQVPSYARGVIGLQGSGTGTSDSISANLSAGESVMTAQTTSMFPNLLSKLNMAGGGQGLGGMTASENSLLQNDINSNSNNAQMIESMANAIYLAAKEGTQKGSTDGLTNLSDNRQIQLDAKF